MAAAYCVGGEALPRRHQKPSGRSAQNRRAKGCGTAGPRDVMTGGAGGKRPKTKGNSTVFIVCPGAPKPSVGSNPEVNVSMRNGPCWRGNMKILRLKLIESKLLSSGSERD